MTTSPLLVKAVEVRASKPNWQTYVQSQILSQDNYATLTMLEGGTIEARTVLFRDKPSQCVSALRAVITKINIDTVLQYGLTMVDDILQEDRQRVEIFHKHAAEESKEPYWTPILAILQRSDSFVVNMGARVITKLASWGKEHLPAADMTHFMTWLRDQLRFTNSEYVQTTTHCLQFMLRVNAYRHSFVKMEGVSSIMQALSTKKIGFQLQYQLTFCLWVLTFDPNSADLASKCNIVPVLADILSESVKEKVTRVTLATFRNMLEKPTDKENVQNNAVAMIQCKVLKQLGLLEGKKTEDQEMTEDLQYLIQTLQASVVDMSSFDEYSSELRSGRLEWSPVHKSEKFWRENAPRLCENNFELVKILVKLLDTVKDPLILCVAVHDVGEFVRHYPRGKTVIENLGGKAHVMAMLTHDEQSVRYESLIAVQKIMVHNWEYLGKQIEATVGKDGGAQTSGNAAAAAVKVN